MGMYSVDEMYYFKVKYKGKIIAIGKQKTLGYPYVRALIVEAVITISQAEYETYQAFNLFPEYKEPRTTSYNTHEYFLWDRI